MNYKDQLIEDLMLFYIDNKESNNQLINEVKKVVLSEQGYLLSNKSIRNYTRVKELEILVCDCYKNL